MPVSRLDVIYRKLLLSKFFTKGWGSADNLQRLFKFRKTVSNRECSYKLVPNDYPVKIINIVDRTDCKIIEGKFRSPFATFLPGLVPEEVQDCYFQMLLPLKWKSEYKPVCIHLAGTGDHYFWRRRNIMAKPLLKEGIGAIILENPFYGVRKPKDQIRSSLHHVSDIFVMGGCLIFECIVLLNWCEERGFGPLGVTGISMGGHMASLAASNWPRPLVLVPCLSWSTASSVFTEGVMSESIDWEMLQDQYKSNDLLCNSLSKQCKIVDNPFLCDLSQNLPGNIFIRSVEKKLADIKDLDIPIHLFDDSNIHMSNITPHQLIHVLNDCRDLTHRMSHTVKKLLAEKEFDSFNLLNPPKRPKLNKKVMEIKMKNKEALWFMRGMMDECTHLRNFSVPYDTSLVISICATADGYVPRNGVSRLEDIWPGATVKYVNCGHVGAYVLHRKLFRDSIVTAFEHAKKKFGPPPPGSLQI
ncbi:protein ABHD18 isoform X1 [Diabrotica virgifera virgifera]|uniref:Protein ABHD18-like isoform X1 n=1 Tax=Diabrotica virgifera virgifera TaxID=50390 RepID=A0A6P7FNC0_DIAVI|nr:protein ABHD18 isoform X1 [Diabrotica virgifera virgifera]